MNKPRLLDLYCCAGGCSMGYTRAGFEVYGVDISHSYHYPFTSICLDAITAMKLLLRGNELEFNNGETYLLKDFSAFHASPPCQAYSIAMSPLLGHKKEHPDLIAPTRALLERTGKPFVIENVPKSPLYGYIKLNGTMFGLHTKKERWFELHHFEIMMLPAKLLNTYGMVKNGELTGLMQHSQYPKEVRANKENLAAAYGIDWTMTRHELRQAIPPAYTEFIGSFLMKEVLSSMPPIA